MISPVSIRFPCYTLLTINPPHSLQAAFKLTSEMIEVMGGLTSAYFAQFCDLCCKAFLAARDKMDDITAVVAGWADSQLPAFLFADTLQQLRGRFRPDLTDSQASQFMHQLVLDAAHSMRTVLYDGVQRMQQGIHSEAWL